MEYNFNPVLYLNSTKNKPKSFWIVFAKLKFIMHKDCGMNANHFENSREKCLI